jgi:predicted chitinase
MDYRPVLLAVAPRGKRAIRDGFADNLPVAIAHAGLTTKARLADFIAQCAHESAGFVTLSEFASGAAYEGRRDLGNVRKGDGRRYKGRSPLQLTGRANYRDVGARLGIANPTLEDDPTQAEKFPLAMKISAEFWRSHNLNRYADADDFKGETRVINGGLNGLANREACRRKAIQALADPRTALFDAADVEKDEADAQVKRAQAVGAGAVATQMPHVAIKDADFAMTAALIAGGVIIAGIAVWFFARSVKAAMLRAELTRAAEDLPEVHPGTPEA